MSLSDAILVLVTKCHKNNLRDNSLWVILHLQLLPKHLCLQRLGMYLISIPLNLLKCTIIIIERTLPAFPVSQTCREQWMEFADIIRISRVDNVRLRRPAEPHAEVMTETPPFSGNV